MADTRECKKCEERKPLGYFKEYAPGKHRYTCKACQEVDQRKYQKRYDEKKRLKKSIEGTPSMRSEIDALKEQVRTILAILDKHGYNTTET